MEDNKNRIRSQIVKGLNKTGFLQKVLSNILGNKEDKCNQIVDNFINMLEDSSLIEKIKNNSELSTKVCHIYNIIEDNHINDK